jgi:molybdopterin-guanine dinucleotide biosynthesis protein B
VSSALPDGRTPARRHWSNGWSRSSCAGGGIATIKHAHHDVDIDQRGTDSWRHRAAGAAEVAVVGGLRYAIMRETAEPTLKEVLGRLQPCDLVIIEGYKREPHLKIEVRADHTKPMASADPNIVAIAADSQPSDDTGLPWFRRDDIAAIADFIAGRISDQQASQ